MLSGCLRQLFPNRSEFGGLASSLAELVLGGIENELLGTFRMEIEIGLDIGWYLAKDRPDLLL